MNAAIPDVPNPKAKAWDVIGPDYWANDYNGGPPPNDIEIYLKGVQRGMRVVVIGASTRFLIGAAIERGARVTVIDFSRRMCDALAAQVDCDCDCAIVYHDITTPIPSDLRGAHELVLADRLINRFTDSEVRPALEQMLNLLTEAGEIRTAIRTGLYPRDIPLIEAATREGSVSAFFDPSTRIIDYSRAGDLLAKHLQPHGSIPKQTLLEFYRLRGPEKRFTAEEIAQYIDDTYSDGRKLVLVATDPFVDVTDQALYRIKARGVGASKASMQPSAGPKDLSPVTVATIAEKYRRGEPLTMLTAYDFPMARLVDNCGVDMILVGDSLANVVLGRRDTLAVTMRELLHHARAVREGARRAFLVADMPFMSYQAGIHRAVRNAGRFLQETGMSAVKLEGGREMAKVVRAIVAAGIPVQGHIGLTPQRHNALGGFKVQGRTANRARQLLNDALALEDAGCFSIVVEAVPDRLAAFITQRLHIPTIGIGAGAGTSGQVLVLNDMLGLAVGHVPKFVKQYAELGRLASEAVAAYRHDVGRRAFPSPEHTYKMTDEEWQEFLAADPGSETLRTPAA